MTAFRPLTAHESYVHALRSEFADCPRRVPTCVTNHGAAVQWCSDVVEAIVIPRGDEPTLHSAIPRAIVAARGALHARGARRTWVTVSDHSARDPGDFHDFALLIMGKGDIMLEIGFEIGECDGGIRFFWSTSMAHRIVA